MVQVEMDGRLLEGVMESERVSFKSSMYSHRYICTDYGKLW